MSTPGAAAPFAPVSRDHAKVVQTLATQAQADPAGSFEMALRTRSPEVLDAIAQLAVPGGRARGLQELGRAVADDLAVTALEELTPDPRWLSELAALTAVQVTSGTPDLRAAWGLWQWAGALDEQAIPPRDRDLRAQVAWVLGGHRDQVSAWAEQHDVLGPEVGGELRADLVNPWLADPETGATASPEMASSAPWQDRVQDILGPRLSPLVVPGGAGAPFDRLASPAGATLAPAGDRSVAIILTAYRPATGLVTAVESILAQTWQEWRLLLVDDASGPEFDELLHDVASRDPRITLLSREQNGGTYQARNTALRAVGNADFITFHDSDDWSHPQRLALSVEPLRADPSVMATTAWGLKATDDLELTRLGYRGTSRVAAGLMFRRDPVATELGFFDPVRKSADKEFQRRITVAFPGTIAEVRDPTAVIRRGHESLSSADHSRGWRHASRRHYQHAYQPWHRQIKRGEATPFLDDVAERRFWAPPRWQRGSSPATTPSYAVVLAADYSVPEAEEAFAATIAAARRGGRSVGLLQLDRAVLHSSPEPPTSTAIVRRVNRGQVDWVYLDDEIAVDQVLVLDPSVLHPGPDLRAVWEAAQVSVALPAQDEPLDRGAALRRARSVFGGVPQWWDPSAEALPEEALSAQALPVRED